MNINGSVKKKKTIVSSSVWKSTVNDEVSSTVIRSLFPELVQSSYIITAMPSKKALSRLGISSRQNVIPLPLERSMQLESKLDQLVRKDLGKITKALLGRSARAKVDSPPSNPITGNANGAAIRNFVQFCVV